MLRAVLFDLWETLINDLPERATPRRAWRSNAVKEALARHGVQIAIEAILAALDATGAGLGRLHDEGKDLAFLKYGFQFRSGQVTEEIVHDSLDAVRDRVMEEARRVGNPAQAIIEGVDDAWEVSIFKFAFEMIRQSWPINRFDLHRRGLL